MDLGRFFGGPYPVGEKSINSFCSEIESQIEVQEDKELKANIKHFTDFSYKSWNYFPLFYCCLMTSADGNSTCCPLRTR